MPPPSKRAFDSDFENSSSDDDNTHHNNTEHKSRAKKKKSRKRKLVTYNPTKLAVIDLDGTLIDKKYHIFPEANTFLTQLYRDNWYIMIWTAGNEAHVKRFLDSYPTVSPFIAAHLEGLVNKIKPVDIARRRCKELLGCYLDVNILVDDKVYNTNNSQYDFRYNILNYCKNRSSDIDYARLLADIKKDTV